MSEPSPLLLSPHVPQKSRKFSTADAETVVEVPVRRFIRYKMEYLGRLFQFHVLGASVEFEDLYADLITTSRNWV